MHVDGPKVVVETAAKRGKFVCGYHASQAKLAPNAYLTGAEWNWLTAYKTIVDAARSGKPHPNFVRGGLKEGFVKMSAYGPLLKGYRGTQEILERGLDFHVEESEIEGLVAENSQDADPEALDMLHGGALARHLDDPDTVVMPHISFLVSRWKPETT